MSAKLTVTVLTLFPEMFPPIMEASILGRAQAQGLLQVQTLDIRSYAKRKHRNADDYPFGGGAGMVMLAQPVVDAMAAACGPDFCGKRIYLSPRGPRLTQGKAESLAQVGHLVLLCGHYEGVDQRALDLCVDEELSIGDYVLTGGELAAMVVIDSVARLVPGVLGSSESAAEESFASGLLEYPQYTRPPVFQDLPVPPVLLGGNHREIALWRLEQSIRLTGRVRPDLLAKWQPPQWLTKRQRQHIQGVLDHVMLLNFEDG